MNENRANTMRTIMLKISELCNKIGCCESCPMENFCEFLSEEMLPCRWTCSDKGGISNKKDDELKNEMKYVATLMKQVCKDNKFERCEPCPLKKICDHTVYPAELKV